MLTIGSLFSGIGGLELGLERALDWETIWQVEQSEYCRSVLEKWWPDAIRFDDVKTVGCANLPTVDLICGGFPCQDLSGANAGGAGLDGDRSGLWREMARVIGEIGPEWVVVENVASGATRWVDAVRCHLAELGYASIPVPIAASDCGALHRRARVFLVAHNEDRAQQLRHETGQGLPGVTSDSRSEELRIEPRRSSRTSRPGASPAAADPDGVSQGQRAEGYERSRRTAIARRARCSAAGWPQSTMDPVVYGLPGRLAERERVALGNSCTPQQAEVVGWVIRELLAVELGGAA